MADAVIRDFLANTKADFRGRLVFDLPATECWPWSGANLRGYGYFRYGNHQIRATHVALILAGKGYGGERIAMHSCDNPACVNPSHLSWANQAENLADMREKGRNSTGEQHSEAMRRAYRRGTYKPAAKLTNEDVAQILADPRGPGEIADTYGIHPQYVYQIKKGERRAHR